MANDNLIQPEVVKPKGIPPKKLLVSVFAGLAIGAIIFSIFTSKEEAPRTADGVARESASKLSDADKSAIGAGVTAVTEAADVSGLPAEFKIGTSAPQQSASSSQAPNASAPYGATAGSSTGFPQAGNGGANQANNGGQKDPGEAARNLESLTSKMIISDFDDAATGAAGKKTGTTNTVAADAGAIGALAGRNASTSDGNKTSAMDPILASLPGLTNAAATKTDNPRNQDNQFIKELNAETEFKKGLRPNRMESPYSIMEGTVIPAITLREINTDMPGVVTAQVTTDVYDSMTARYPLICKGSKLIGKYSSDVKVGQSRMLFAFTRLILTDGQSFNLAGFDGSDMGGSAGVQGDVNNHFLKIYGTSLAIGVLTDQVTRSSAVPQGAYAQPSATGQIMLETTKNILNRNRDIAPTITYERASLINVEVKRDMVFQQPAQRSCK